MQIAVLLCRYDAETDSWAPQTRYTLQRNTASVIKGLVLVCIVLKEASQIRTGIDWVCLPTKRSNTFNICIFVVNK